MTKRKKPRTQRRAQKRKDKRRDKSDPHSISGFALYPKTPSFRDTDGRDYITGVAFRLIAVREDVAYASGTAVSIATGLLATARHVVEDHWRRFEGRYLGDGHSEGSFTLKALQVGTKEHDPALWVVRRIWLSPCTDVAFLGLAPSSGEARTRKWINMAMSLEPPAIGTRVCAFGYRESTAKVVRRGNDTLVECRDAPTTSVGEVVQVFKDRRDRSMLSFPCFQTNSRFAGGMSGGPVVNDTGELCGLVCGSMQVENPGHSGTSYVALLWPSMATVIDMDRTGHPRGVKYPVIELVRNGFMTARGWERVVVEMGEDDQVKTLGFRWDDALIDSCDLACGDMP